jgi:prefoldin subunit 5
MCVRATAAKSRRNRRAEEALNALERRINILKHVLATLNLVHWPVARDDETLHSGAFERDGTEALFVLGDIVN